MAKLEYIIDASTEMPARNKLIRAAETGSTILRLTRLDRIQSITIRNIDSSEYDNIATATRDGSLDTYAYVRQQIADRRQYDISADNLSILITDKPLIHIRPDGSSKHNHSGWSVKSFGEAVTTLDNYSTSAKPTNGLIHTLIHETGHLLGAADRQTGEKHCVSPHCVMESDTTIQRLTSSWHLARLAMRPFCPKCLSDIKTS